MGFQKLKPKIIAYRNYKSFDNAQKSTIFNIFNHHVLIKKKNFRSNEASFTSKELRKAIMKRSRLRNIFLKLNKSTAPKEISIRNS